MREAYMALDILDRDGLVFTENRGQVGNGEVLLYHSSGAFSIGFAQDGILMDLPEAPRAGDGRAPVGTAPVEPMESSGPVDRVDPARGCILRLGFMGANPVRPVGRDPVPWASNFFLGNDAEGWQTDVPSYRQVVYEGLWDGIDLVYGSSQGRLKYEFVVHPGADPSDIHVSVEGQSSLEVASDGQDMVIRTLLGAEVRDGQLMACYGDGSRGTVEATFTAKDGSTYGFDLGPYDATRPLIIDPLVYSTFIGGSYTDTCNDVVVDGDGNSYIAGSTWSTDFPTTPGAYNRTMGVLGGFVLMLDSSGSALVYSTFIGSANIFRIAIDPEANVLITGRAYVDEFPVTCDDFIGGTQYYTLDAFVMKLAADGSRILFSTPIGGIGYEEGHGIAVDDEGNSYIAGYTSSRDFPTTPGAYNGSDPDRPSSDEDLFILKLSAAGDNLEYSSTAGGTSRDRAYDLALGANGSAFVTGYTQSEDFPTTTGAFCSTSGGYNDAFVLGLSPDGSSVVLSTLLCGDGIDEAHGIAMDSEDCAYVTGWTTSSDFPTTDGAYQSGYGRGAFITKLSPDGTSLGFSSIVGDAVSNDVSLGPDGDVYAVGTVKGQRFPTTEDAYDRTYNGGSTYLDSGDVFLSVLSSNGTDLVYSSYFGAGGRELGNALAIDGLGSIYIVGETTDVDYPTSSSAYCTVYNGETDGFAFKHDIKPPVVLRDSTSPNATVGDDLTFEITVEDGSGVSEVNVTHWQGNSTARQWDLARMVSGTSRNGTWSADVTLSRNSIETMHYTVAITDVAGNRLDTAIRDVTVVDDELPEVEELSPSGAPVGEAFEFIARVSDNIGVGSVQVLYWYGNLTTMITQLNMSAQNPTGIGNGTYRAGIVVKHTALALSHYYIVTDTSGNQNISRVMVTDVVDRDPPMIYDQTPTSAENGEEFHFYIEADDNGLVDHNNVTVNYWFGDGPSDAINRTMQWMGIYDSDALDDNWRYSLQIPMDSLGPLSYFFAVADVHGNWNVTPVRTVMIHHGPPPTVVQDLSDKVATTGDPFLFRVEVTDNMGIAKVLVNYTTPGHPMASLSMHGETLTGKGNGTYRLEMSVPLSIGNLTYVFDITDLTGNQYVTEPVRLPIQDNDPPRFLTDRTQGSAIKGMEFGFFVDVMDASDGAEVFLEYWSSGGTHRNRSMDAPRSTPDRISYTFGAQEMLPRHIAGPLFYLFSTKDRSGNWNVTVVKSIRLLNLPPVVVADLMWNATEGQEAILSLGPYLSDGNDAVGNLTLSILSGDARQEGLSLRVNHSSWAPDYRIAISVSDGEDTAFGNITVHVTNVNDPPIITQMSPGSNSTFKQAEAIAFSVNATDEDDDAFSYTWTVDGSMLREERAFTLDGLPPGKHEVVVTVSDGRATASSSITVTVKETKKPVVGGGTLLYLLVALLLIALVAVSLVWRQHHRGSKAAPPPAAGPARKP